MATDRTVTTQYPGARVTRLVDRGDVLETIEAAVRDRSGQTVVFYIEAEGGTGKTFLARHVLELCRRRDKWGALDLLAARHELDFYHYHTRSQEGFMASFVEEMGGGQDCFSAYYEEHQRLQELKFQTFGAIFDPQRAELAAKFLDACTALSRHKRMVVVLDTVERLVYETDRIQQKLELGEKVAGLRHWLLDQWLPAMSNAVIFICSRPKDPPLNTLADELKTAALACNAHFKPLTLRDFKLNETKDYIDAVHETAQQDGNERALRRLKAISPESRRVIHLLTDGRPITLALIVDYYLATERLMDAIKRPASEIKALPKQKKNELREQVKADIVRLFREIGRPADEALLAMAWTPMGLDAELLSAVTGEPLPEAQPILRALSDPRQGLSFVKIRDQRVFLHDEMYALLWKYVLQSMLPQAERVYDAVLEIYRQRIAAQQEEIQRLRETLRLQPLPVDTHELIPVTADPLELQEMADAQATLDALQVEEVYYLLRRDPVRGFAQYCEYAQAAVMDHNEDLDMQLRDQMFGFMREAVERGYDPRGLQRDAVERDSALRWGWSLVYRGDLDAADKLVEHLREHEPDWVAAGGPLAQTEMDVIDGWATAHLGRDMEAVERHLDTAIGTLTTLPITTPLERRRRNVLLAQAYNVMGYLLRVQGRFSDACESYKQALPLWRDLRREADHAEALNNLSFAMAMTGNYRRALRECRDGLDLRELIGYLHSIALSRNTLGLIEILNDQPHRGLVHCQDALRIFRYLGAARGVGLACTALAEAYRRSAGARRVYPRPVQIERLREAERYAEEAVEIFRHEAAKGLERLRLVEALIELGCAQRNLAGMCVDDDQEQCAKLTTKSEAALKEAAEIAGKELGYRQVDALTNLAWLYYYVRRPSTKVEAALSKAESAVPDGYQITQDKGMPRVNKPITFFWVQLSKMHALRGQMAIRRYWDIQPQTKGQVRDEALLRQATQEYTLALEYGDLFAEDYRDLRRLKDELYDQASKANIGEFRIIYQAISDSADKYHLVDPTRPRRPRILKFLEENFGMLEAMERGQGWT